MAGGNRTIQIENLYVSESNITFGGVPDAPYRNIRIQHWLKSASSVKYIVAESPSNIGESLRYLDSVSQKITSFVI